MRDLNFVADRLEDINRELTISNYTGFLEESTRKVRNIASGEEIYLDVFFHSAANEKVKSWFQQLSPNQTNNYVINAKNDLNNEVKVFKQVLSAMAVIAFDETLKNAGTFVQKIRTLLPQYKFVLVVNFFNNDDCQNFKTALGYGPYIAVAAFEDVAQKNIEELLKTVLPEAEKLAKINKLTYLNSIKPLFTVLDEVFLAENKAISTRKLLNSQNMQIVRKEEQGLNLNDVGNNIRQVLQKFSQDTDKNLRGKYDDLNKPNTGQFAKLAQKQVEQLIDFERELMAEKNERVAVRINKPFQDNVVKTVSTTIIKDLGRDEAYLNTALEDLLSQVNIQLNAKCITAVQLNEVFMPLPEKQRVVNSYAYISKQYQGEIIKKGPTEYFVALRDYIGVIMVATGLLAPLNMIASLQDEHSFLKQMNVGIKYATAFITIGLIIYGIFDLQKRIPKKREEEFHRELGKARETISTEIKRMFNESTRDWVTNVTVWIRDISQNINNVVDRNLKQLQSSKMQQMNQDKGQQQRLQQSIDLLQRNIQSAERIKEQLAIKFRDMVNENERDLKF